MVVAGGRAPFAGPELPYQGSANADSPLFTEQTTSGVMVALVWKFWASERRAAASDDHAIF
jgi:hypothetical protein